MNDILNRGAGFSCTAVAVFEKKGEVGWRLEWMGTVRHHSHSLGNWSMSDTKRPIIWGTRVQSGTRGRPQRCVRSSQLTIVCVVKGAAAPRRRLQTVQGPSTPLHYNKRLLPTLSVLGSLSSFVQFAVTTHGPGGNINYLILWSARDVMVLSSTLN